MSDLVGNPEDRFSRVAAHIYLQQLYKAALKHTVRSFLFLSSYFVSKRMKIKVKSPAEAEGEVMAM